MSRFEGIEDQAAQWLAREDRGFEASELAAFEAWLNEATAHKVAYLRLKAAWQRTDRLAALRQPALASPPRTRVWTAATAYRALAAVLLLTAGVGLGGNYLIEHRRASIETVSVYATQVGQQRTLRLADGTSVELNTNTRLRATMTGSARVVKLEQGEAYFDVSHDANRPFVVFAGNRKITDIGTKFSVRRDGDDVQVLVAEGRVRVDIPNAHRGDRPIEAGPASMIMAKADGTLVAQKSHHDIADRLSWREGMLVFDQDTLAVAAAEFNRYNNKHIIVVGPARDQRIGGRFRPDNVEVFVSLIKEGFGLKIERTGTEIVVSE
jgi:transmembrane sensor